VRWKALELRRRVPSGAAADVVAVWTAAMPVLDWLDRQVGASTLERPRR
jgi:hypothetical protein